MVSANLLQQIANPVNDVQQAFDAKAGQLQAERDKETERQRQITQQQDADFHKVVQYAGDGLIDEAKYFAQQKGIQVPEAVFSNATFAKGLSIAGNLYADDPERAQAFTQAFMGGQGDLASRMAAGIQVAGKPISQSDRDFANFVRKEQWKLKNGAGASDKSFTLSPGASRYDSQGNLIATAPASSVGPKDRLDYGSKAYNAALGGTNPARAEEARQAAYKEWDAVFGPQAASAGLTAMPVTAEPAPTADQGVYAVQQLLMRGFTPQQISDTLVQGGATPDQARTVLQAAGASLNGGN